MKREFHVVACEDERNILRHFVYGRRLGNGDIGIVTFLHERMHQIDRFRDDHFG